MAFSITAESITGIVMKEEMTDMKNVVVIENSYDEVLKKKIQKKVEEYGYACCFFASQPEAEQSDCLKDCEILYGQADSILKKLPSLKLLHLNSAGNDRYLDHPDLKEDVILSNASGSFGVSIAEYLIMQTLNLLRDGRMYMHAQKEHRYERPHEIGGIVRSVITVIGTGNIGEEYAKRARAFMPRKIIGVNRSGRVSEYFDETVAVEKLDEVLPQTDILVLCVPRTEKTTHLISSERLARMKPSAILLNVGRGNAIDEDALMQALNQHQIAGAALDVFQNEPVEKDSGLWDTENLLITPHISGNLTLQYTRERNVEIFLDQLERYCTNKELINVVDCSLGY